MDGGKCVRIKINSNIRNKISFQLLSGLEEIGLGTELHYLQILEVVSKLMNVPDGEVDDLWSELYIDFMQEAVQFEITFNDDTLKPLATTCYGRLQSLLEDEKDRFLPAQE